MKRIPIGFTERQQHRLRREAAARHVSVATLVRDAVDRVYPDDLEKRRRLHELSMSAVGAFRDVATDVSERHDDYLADALWDDLRRHDPG